MSHCRICMHSLSNVCFVFTSIREFRSHIIFLLQGCLFLITSGFSQSSTVLPKLQVSYQVFEAPTDPDEWGAWRQRLTNWKDSVLQRTQYKGSTYDQTEFAWSTKAFATYFLVPNEVNLYDSNWNMNIKQCLRKYEENYGGVDIVVLFPTYPQLGFDDRDQFEFYNSMPGGVDGIRRLCEELHKMGKRFMIAYNPWDNIGKKTGKTDEDELIKLLTATGADGVFLDTISSVENFFEKVQSAKRGAVFQAEIPVQKPEMMNQVHQTWFELGWHKTYKNLEFLEVPHIVKNRWIDRRHMVYRLSRFSHELSSVIQNAWINGCGYVIWENVFGTVNEMNPRDRSLLRTMFPIQRTYSDFFTRGEWTPLYPVLLNRVYAALWKLKDQRLFTLINRQEQPAIGKLMQLEYIPGIRYFDLVSGKEAITHVEQNKVNVFVDMKPKAIGCILALPEAALTADFVGFLEKQARIYKSADFSTEYQIPQPVMKVPVKTVAYSRIPGSMVHIPVPGDSVIMKFTFRQRECGFYPMQGFVDYSYSQALNEPVTGTLKFKLSPFAIDETLVTNAQFQKFIKASNYKPKVADNFLKHWINNAPPKGLEQHPVVWITLDDARAYAAWAGKRLPTEAEWQWAAQNGSQETAFPWGSTMDSALCNNGTLLRTTPVKKYEKGRTGSGLYDMSGNVWQMTESERFDGYSRFMILRGGGWYVNQNSHWYADQGPQQTSFGAKYLFYSPGADRCATVGFRCVVDVSDTAAASRHR